MRPPPPFCTWRSNSTGTRSLVLVILRGRFFPSLFPLYHVECRTEGAGSALSSSWFAGFSPFPFLPSSTRRPDRRFGVAIKILSFFFPSWIEKKRRLSALRWSLFRRHPARRTYSNRIGLAEDWLPGPEVNFSQPARLLLFFPFEGWAQGAGMRQPVGQQASLRLFFFSRSAPDLVAGLEPELKLPFSSQIPGATARRLKSVFSSFLTSKAATQLSGGSSFPSNATGRPVEGHRSVFSLLAEGLRVRKRRGPHFFSPS